MRLLLVVCGAAFSGGRLLRNGQGHSTRDLPACSCDCCEVAKRRADEVNLGVQIKCAPSDSHSSDMCTEECLASDTDKILPSTDGTLQYMRFCFYECKPFQGLSSPLASECLDLDNEDIKLVIDADGNAQDPAVAFAAAAQREAHNRTVALMTAKAAQKADPEAVKVLANNMKRQATNEGAAARAEAEASRVVEAGHAEDLNTRLKQQVSNQKAGLSVGFQGLSDIHQAMINAEKEAAKAAEAAQVALSSVHAGKKQAWEVAMGEGQKSVIGVKAAADAKAAKDAAKYAVVVNRVEVKMAEAAAKAANPYFLSMLRAQESVKDYTVRATKNAAQAVAREKEARSLEKAARKLQSQGKMAVAEGKIASAQELMKSAQDLAKQARQLFASADAINKSVPKYAAAAQAAAARAAFEAAPHWPGGGAAVA